MRPNRYADRKRFNYLKGVRPVPKWLREQMSEQYQGRRDYIQLRLNIDRACREVREARMALFAAGERVS